MKNLAAILLIFLTQAVFGQWQMPVQLSKQPLIADTFIGIDKFGYAYVLDDNALIKVGEGQRAEFKLPAMGKISKIDLENPLLIPIFYKSFNTVVLVDNQLNEVRRINFSELLQQDVPIVVEATGIASQNRLWIYDNVRQQIGLFDYSRDTYLPLNTSLKGNVRYYETDFNAFRWIDENWILNSCDIFGKITTLGKVPAFDAVQTISDIEILYVKEGKLNHFNIENNKNTLIEIGDKSFGGFYYKGQILSIFTKEGISNYKITLP